MAFHRLTGEVLWNTEIIDYRRGFAATSAPLVVGNLVVIGVAGGEFGIRGFFDAYDAETGARDTTFGNQGEVELRIPYAGVPADESISPRRFQPRTSACTARAIPKSARYA